MKAVRIHRHGGPEVLQYEEAPVPTPGDGDVLIRVKAAGVNPVDWKIREGWPGLKVHFPLVLGWDVAGVIEAAGAGVSRLKVGDEVYGRPDITRDGAYAEFMVARESEIALKPKSMDFIHAAATPLAALTAWQALFDTAGLGSGQKALIHAAAGGVGSFAVQLAKWKGAKAIGTASERNQEFVERLGADQTIDYTGTKFEDVVHDADVVLDTIGGETQQRSFKALKKGGFLVSTVSPPSQEQAKLFGVRASHMRVLPNAEQLGELAKLADSGKLKVAVERVMPLSEARAAHELSQTGHARGKIVLKV